MRKPVRIALRIVGGLLGLAIMVCYLALPLGVYEQVVGIPAGLEPRQRFAVLRPEHQ